MKVLMFGWEFPPYNQGGLGTACYGLTRALSSLGTEVTFVLPKNYPEMKSDFVKLISADIKTIKVNSPLTAYMTSEEYLKLVRNPSSSKNSAYGQDLFQEVERYAKKASLVAQNEEHDVIHAHDWLTYKAGIEAKKVSQKPLVVHVHATEFDRTGGNGVNSHVYQIEKEGLEKADQVIAVSNFTKNKIIQHYNIKPDKIKVVHNAVDFNNNKFNFKKEPLGKIVLFLGRITLQKGPDYFLYAAKKVLETDPYYKFIIAGSGDMETEIIEKAAQLGIGDKVLFTGFLRGAEVDQAFQMADLFVMPSVSEPFGITPLEAMRNDTPCLISKQSGVSEVISHCLKVDFWDIEDMANKIIAATKYHQLNQTLSQNGHQEVLQFNWEEPAQKCLDVYNQLHHQSFSQVMTYG